MPGVVETARALISVKADVSDAKAAIKSLRGEERKAAQDRLAELEQQNSRMDKHIAMWGKIAVGVGTVTAAAVAAKAAMNAYLEDMRLESAAAGASLGGLQRATHGLIEADNLLAFAGKAMHGTWKLNQEQMETVLHGAMALRKTMGAELQPTIEALTESIAKGNTRALHEFGIEAKDKEGVLRELDGLYQGLHGNVSLAGDAMQKAGTDIKNSFDDIKGELGRLVLELQPAIQALASFVGWLADAAKNANSLTDAMIGVDTSAGQTRIGQQRKEVARLRAEARRLRGKVGPEYGATSTADDSYLLGSFAARDLERQANELEFQTNQMAHAAGQKAAKSFVDGFANMLFNGKAGGASTPGSARGGAGRDVVGAPIGFSFHGGDVLSGVGASLGAGFRSWNDQRTAALEVAAYERGEFARQAAQKKLDTEAASKAQLDSKLTDLSSITGVPKDIDAHAEAVQALAGAYNVLGSAAGDAYEALVTGSMSATEAMKRALAQGLLAMGRDFFVRALGETAMGLGSLAIGGPLAGASASEHFAAAAAFGAASVAAGVAANALGVGGGPGARASAGGARAPSVTGGAGGTVERGPTNVTVILGSGYDNMSERERNARVARAVKRGMGADHSTTIRDG